MSFKEWTTRKVRTVICDECGHEFEEPAESCPYCGAEKTDTKKTGETAGARAEAGAGLVEDAKEKKGLKARVKMALVAWEKSSPNAWARPARDVKEKTGLKDHVKTTVKAWGQRPSNVWARSEKAAKEKISKVRAKREKTGGKPSLRDPLKQSGARINGALNNVKKSLSTKWETPAIVVAVVILLIVLIVGLVVGLSPSKSDRAKSEAENKAKVELKAAEAAYDALNNNLIKLQSSLTAAISQALTGNYSLVTANIWLYNNDQQRNKALQDLARVGAMYKQVLSLPGVADYKAYANAMLTVISTNAQLLNQGKSLLETLMPISGNKAAVRKFFDTKAIVISMIQSSSGYVTKAEAGAQKIKQDKSLSW